MKRIARFEKVSPCLFEEAGGNPEQYEALKKPARATVGSAGYDFFAPFDIEVSPGEAVTVPTGFRVYIENGWVLSLYPRSGLGFKFKMQLQNTVGIIDSDYYYSANEGHIMIKIFNDSREGKTIRIPAGCAFAQGIFTEFGITEDDCVTSLRDGGFGSTDSRK